ncbi:hypothetical protein EGH14_08795 [Neisseria gonorrhoeae]|nr:hypothetical protein EGH14_08795 [Neisseria gonorrhoeae]
MPQLGECPLPGPPPRGRERIAADFAVAGGLKSNLDLPLISGRMKNKKQPAQAVLVCINLNPNSHPVLSPCGRELERGQQAARFGRLREFGKVATWRFGEGAGCGRFCGCRRFEKQIGFTTVDFRSYEK